MVAGRLTLTRMVAARLSAVGYAPDSLALGQGSHWVQPAGSSSERRCALGHGLGSFAVTSAIGMPEGGPGQGHWTQEGARGQQEAVSQRRKVVCPGILKFGDIFQTLSE